VGGWGEIGGDGDEGVGGQWQGEKEEEENL
jgi:hypothetical protein